MRAPGVIVGLILLMLLAGCGASARPDLGRTGSRAGPADPVTEYPTPNPQDTAVDAGTCAILVGLSRDRPQVHRRIVRACAPTAHGGVVIVSRRLVRSAGRRPRGPDSRRSHGGNAGQR